MKSFKKLSVVLAAAAMMLASCNVNDPIYDTDHPNHGTITLTTDWSQIGAGITKPTNYMIEVGVRSVPADKDKYTIPKLFEAGTYKGSAYNKVAVATDKISIVGTVATVEATTTVGFIEANPGWLFTAHNDNVVIEKDKDHEFTAVMQQQVRELALVIEPTGGTVDKIESITAELSGVAQSWDFATNTPSGAAAKVVPEFTKITSGAAVGKYTATVRLLGVTGLKQELTVTLKFTGGTLGDLTITSNLTSVLATFNALPDAKTPLTLSTTVVETQTETGFTCNVNNWAVVPSRPGTAN